MTTDQLAQVGAIGLLALTLFGLIAAFYRGKLWTSPQVEALRAHYQELVTIERQRADTAQARADAATERADIRERDMAASLATLGASSARIEVALARHGTIT